MLKRLKPYLWSRSGATAVEYAFIAGLLSIAIIIGVAAVGLKLNAKVAPVSSGLN